MTENQEPTPTGYTPEEFGTDTSDVRAAIERAKESLEAPVQQPPTETYVAEPVQMPSAVEASVYQTLEPLPAQDPQPLPEMPATVVAPVAPAAPAEQLPQALSIPSDHPMAPLYIQQPMPPTPKANRLAGVLISLLATAAFSLLYAGLIAAILAPALPPSQFLQGGLFPYLTSLGFVLPVVAFFVLLMILVLIFNRGGWWVYAVLGVVVALGVWAAAGAGYALSPQLLDETIRASEASKPFDISRIATFAMTLPAVLAAFAAREVVVWFGAWIGARGRRIKAKNTEEMKEYEAKLAEVQSQVL